MTTSQRRPQPIPFVVIVVVALMITGFIFSPTSVDGIRTGTTASSRTNSLRKTSLPWPSLPVSYLSLSPSRSFRTRLFDSSSPQDSREEEIRKKIKKLKEDGRLGNSQGSPEASPDGSERRPRKGAYDQYADKVQGKLGKRQGQILGFTGDGTKNWGSKTSSKDKEKEYDDIDAFIAEEEKVDAAEMLKSERELPDQDERGRQVATIDARGRRVGRIGSLPEDLLPPKEPDTIDQPRSEEGAKDQKININPAMFDLPDKDEDEPPELTEEELVEEPAR